MELLDRTLTYIDNFRRKKNADWVGLIVGPPGTGKSNLGIYCGMKLDKNFTVEKISNSPTETVTLFKTSDRYSTILYDEGMKSLMSRRAMSTDNIEQISSMAQLRQKRNLVVFIVAQDLNLIEKHIKSSRAFSLFRCMFGRDENGMPQQGPVAVYGIKGLRQIKVDTQGVVRWPKPNYIDNVPDVSGTKIWKDYEKISDTQKDDSIQTSLDKMEEKSGKKQRVNLEMELEVLKLRKLHLTIGGIQKKLLDKFGRTISVHTIWRIIHKGKTSNK